MQACSKTKLSSAGKSSKPLTAFSSPNVSVVLLAREVTKEPGASEA